MSAQDCEQLTLFPADSPASPFPWLESKRERKTIVTSGRRCSELSESCARAALSVRTYLESSRLPPGKWSRIWSVQAITSSCLILKLRLSELGTEDRESSLWGTPNTMDAMPCRSFEAMKRQATNGGRKNRKRPGNLREQVNPEMIRAYQEASAEANGRMLTTPCAADATGSHGGNNHRSLRTDVAGQLNPTWVEWLMGFPIGWTELNASETL